MKILFVITLHYKAKRTAGKRSLFSDLRPETAGVSPWCFIFDSMINIRPRQNNRSRGVENEEIRNKILEVVRKLIV